MDNCDIQSGHEPGTYTILSSWDRECIIVTALGLVEIGKWVKEHEQQIMEEAVKQQESED